MTDLDVQTLYNLIFSGWMVVFWALLLGALTAALVGFVAGRLLDLGRARAPLALAVMAVAALVFYQIIVALNMARVRSFAGCVQAGDCRVTGETYGVSVAIPDREGGELYISRSKLPAVNQFLTGRGLKPLEETANLPTP